jgi:4-hydroxy-3-methylbut-2-enyl diphosphate reductase IspH
MREPTRSSKSATAMQRLSEMLDVCLVIGLKESDNQVRIDKLQGPKRGGSGSARLLPSVGTRSDEA